MKILYEDKDILVCHKEAGLATQSAKSYEKDLVSVLKTYLVKEKKEKGNPYLGVIHRLDQPVEGLLVFARTQVAAKKLSAQLQSGTLNKDYKALVYGRPGENKGTLTDYLRKDGNVAKVSNKEDAEAKKAVLQFTIVESDATKSSEQETLLNVHIETGRFHQIRAQLSHAGFPIIGDQKYGSADSIDYSKTNGYRTVQLKADYIAFVHPITGKKMEFSLTDK